MDVPRRAGFGESQLFGELGSQLRPARSIGCQRAGRAPELKLKRFVKRLRQAAPTSMHPAVPARGLVAERGRNRWLEKGPRQHNGVGVLVREPSERTLETGMILRQDLPRFAEEKDKRGIENVLACSAPVNEARRIRISLENALGQGFDERDGQAGGRSRFFRERCGIDLVGVSDGSGGALWDHVQTSLGCGKRRFEAKHGANHSGVREYRRERRGGTEAVDQPVGH